MLRIVAGRIETALRGMDTVARIGGDEFFVILTSVKTREAVAGVAEKLLQAISQPITLAGKELQLGASIGIARYPDDATVAGELTILADRAMYRVKKAGKNSYGFIADYASGGSTLA